MKIKDITKQGDRFLDMLESASSGATSSASVASVANPMGAINRRPSLFGYIPEALPTEKKARKKRK